MDNVEEFIGCDFGITDIVCTSEGKTYSSQSLNQYRKKRRKIRSSIQSKGTRSSRRLLKRLNKRERTTAMIINHTISNQIITDAKTKGVGVAIEDLSNIRSTSKRRSKSFRTELNSWSFYQLRTFLEYKAKRVGVPLIAVQPAYTSQTCCNCHHIGTRNNKSFKFGYCGNNMDADINAAKNIALIGAVVNQPEKSSMWSCSLHITA